MLGVSKGLKLNVSLPTDKRYMFKTVSNVRIICVELNLFFICVYDYRLLPIFGLSAFSGDVRLLCRQTESSSRRLTRSESRTGTLKTISDGQVGDTSLEPEPDSSNIPTQHVCLGSLQ